MEIISLLFICFFNNILTEIIINFTPIIDKINENSINSEESKIIIDSTKNIMNEYPFINILKNPPLIDEKKYFEEVDIIKELDNLQSKIENNSMNYYEYYQKYLKIIKKTNDLHIGFYYYGESEELSDILIFPPFKVKIDKEKKLYLSPNNIVISLEIEEQVPNFDTILKKENIPIKLINDESPIDFIRNFCKEYFTFKNKNAKFSFTILELETYFYLSDCPLNYKDFNLTIEYEDNETIKTNFIGYIVRNEKSENNNSNNSKYDYFNNFLKKEKRK